MHETLFALQSYFLAGMARGGLMPSGIEAVRGSLQLLAALTPVARRLTEVDVDGYTVTAEYDAAQQARRCCCCRAMALIRCTGRSYPDGLSFRIRLASAR
jgi:hypothetical protein